MTKTSRTILTIVVVTAVSLGALGAVGYAFRGRLTETPIVASVLDRLGWRTDANPVGGDGEMGDMSDMATPGSMPDATAATAEPIPA